MAVYTHPMINWHKRIGNAGPWWSHLIADTPAELHEMAEKIGLLRSWFQSYPDKASVPHYDIGSDRIYEAAIAAGTIECKRNIYVSHQRRIRDAARAGTWK